MEALWRDFRFAVRGIRRHPVFSLTVVSVLALGIAATTSIFAVVDVLVLQPLNFEDPSRLIHLDSSMPKRGIPNFAISTVEYLDYLEQNRSFEDIAAFGGSSETFNLRREDQPERLAGRRVTANLFDVLGVKPALGRSFLPNEQGPDSPQVLLLSDGLWRREFGADPQAVGRDMLLDDVPYTIIGVLPPGIAFPSSEVEAWLPMEFDLCGLSRRIRRFRAVGRLKEGVSLAAAREDMAAIASRLEEQYPESNSDFEAHVVPLHENLFGENFGRSWMVALASVLSLLAIACANVAGLILIRATARQRELAIRTTLGAGRFAIVRHFLAESAGLAGLGAALALAFSYLWGIPMVKALIPPQLPRLEAVQLNLQIIGFTVLLTVLTTIVCGCLPPALLAVRSRLTLSLGEGGRSGTARVGNLARTGLVVVQVALAFTLLAAAAVLVRSFNNMEQLDRGIRTENRLAVRLTVPVRKYPQPAELITHLDQILDKIRALPGVREAAVINELPATGYINWGAQFTVEGRPAPPTGQEPICQIRIAGPGYFRVMGIEVLEGRDFSSSDQLGETDVIVVNRTLARQHFPGQSAVGQYLQILGRPAPAEIIAVVSDVRQAGPREPIRPSVYATYTQRPSNTTSLVLWTGPDPAGLVPAVRQAVAGVDPGQAVYSVETVDQAVADDANQERALARLFSLLVLVAVLLTTTGLYGVVAYSMAQRTREFGIRVALGAGKREILRLGMRRGAGLTAIGLTAGFACSLAVNPVLTPLLFEVESFDPGILIGVSAILAGVSLMAAFLPARRAAAADPVRALKFE